MQSLEKCEELLQWLESVSFRFRPKTSEPFDKGLFIAQIYQGLSETDRQHILKTVQPSTASKLLSLSAFMAERAIDTKNADWIKAAIVLHVIEDFRRDYRENLRYLVLIAHAAKEIKADLSKITNAVLSIASDRTRSHLNDFLGRDEQLNNLSSFGVKQVKINNESRFVPI